MRSLVSSSESNALTLTVGGTTAAGIANGLYCVIDGYRVGLTTTGGHTPAQAASALQTAIDAALPATYSTALDTATITVSRTDAGVVTGYGLAKDSGLTLTDGGQYADAVDLDAATVAGTGRPAGYSDGYDVHGRIDGDDGAVIDGQAEVVAHVRLLNESSTTKSAFVTVWGYTEATGWMEDPSYTAATLQCAAAAPFATSVAMPLLAPYDAVKVELLGATSGGTDLIDCWVDARLFRV